MLSIEVPRKSPQKSGVNSLGDLSYNRLAEGRVSRAMTTGRYGYSADGLEYEYILRRHDDKRLFVLLSGFADRKKLEPPVFQRWSWAQFFPGNCLYISDPTLHLNRLIGLGWYVGSETQSPLAEICRLICDVAERIGVADHEVFLYASSGGGFAALKLINLLPRATAIVINPQIVITEYDNPAVERLLKVSFNGISRADALRKFPERLSLLHDRETLVKRKILYIQNTLDVHHYKKHFGALDYHLGFDEAHVRESRKRVMLFEDEGGHSKGESPDMFPNIVNLGIEISALPHY